MAPAVMTVAARVAYWACVMPLAIAKLSSVFSYQFSVTAQLSNIVIKKTIVDNRTVAIEPTWWNKFYVPPPPVILMAFVSR
jgi:hypothetical protein